MFLRTLHPDTFPRAATATQRSGEQRDPFGNSQGETPPPLHETLAGARRSGFQEPRELAMTRSRLLAAAPDPACGAAGRGDPPQVREEGPPASRARAGGGRPACVRNCGCQGRGRSPRRGGGVRRGPRARAGPELLPSAGGARGRLAPGSGPTHRLLPRLR